MRIVLGAQGLRKREAFEKTDKGNEPDKPPHGNLLGEQQPHQGPDAMCDYVVLGQS